MTQRSNMAKKIIVKESLPVPQETAKTLQIVELEMKTLKDQYETKMKPLEAKSKEMRASLLQAMQATRIKSIKLDDETVYARIVKTSFEVTDEKKAMEWAEKNHCLRLDKVTANTLLRRTIGVPEG